MKINDVKMGVFRVVCIAAKNHGQAFSACFPLHSRR